MNTMFRGMTKEEWKERDNLFVPAYLIKEWVKSKNDSDMNQVLVYAVSKGEMLGRSVAEKMVM